MIDKGYRSCEECPAGWEDRSYYGFNEYEAAYTEGKEAAIEALKEEVLALKGGEQE